MKPIVLNTPLTKAVATQQSQLPQLWQQATYAPGYPIQPIARVEETTTPREIDYPIAVNASLQPRTGYNLMPFSTLQSAYESIAEVRNPVLIILRELNGFFPRLVDRRGNEITDHEMRWMTRAPDRVTPFNIWLTRFLKSSFVYDAGSVFIEEQQGHLHALHYVDGSTLFMIVDEYGRTPQPEDRSSDPQVIQRYLQRATEWARRGNPLPVETPAYAQVIKGTPFAWYSQNQIWYRPRSRRMDAPYGESFIEQAWAWILIISNITAFELSHYREGNMPEGWFESPSDWSLERIAAFEMAFNARMSSGPTERMRGRFLPSGFRWHETKKADFPIKLYEKARDNILHAIGLPPSEIGDVPGQGLGGKGFQEAMQSALFRNALLPPKTYLEGMFNELLDRYDVDDVKFELALPTGSIDPDKHRQGVIEGFQAGLLTMNDALGQLGLPSVANGDKHVIIMNGQVIVLEDLFNGAPPPVGGQPNPAAGEQPEVHPTFTPEDHQAAVTMLQTAETDGQFSTNGHKTFSTDAWRKGIEEESKEHPTIASNMSLIEQLVRDHLTEDPNYYERVKLTVEDLDLSGLRKEEPVVPVQKTLPYVDMPKEPIEKLEKHCGVCPEDDEYYRAPIVHETAFTFPENHHANDVEIVMMTPSGLEPKPALWKPQGGELDVITERLGGPLYPREEAAYLLDRSLGFYLVPVAYVSEVDGEKGAVVYYTHDAGEPKNPEDYGRVWLERAGVFDYAISQLDRGPKHNYFTHPDDPDRIILFDNSYAFPDNPEIFCTSPFCSIMGTNPLSDETMRAMKVAYNDMATWADIEALIGHDAMDKTRVCLEHMIEWGAVHDPEAVTA